MRNSKADVVKMQKILEDEIVELKSRHDLDISNFKKKSADDWVLIQ